MPQVRKINKSKVYLGIAAGLFASAQVHADAQVDGHAGIEVIVVTASGAEQALRDAPASITVVTRADLERSEVTSLADALRGIQGVNVNYLDARDGKTGNQSISLRGLPRDYTLVLIDGVRQNPTATVAPNSFVDSQSVFIPPISAIERIEVIRGPMSALYGSDALGGVINIITRRPTQDIRGSVTVTNTFQSDSDFGGRSEMEAFVSGGLSGGLGDERVSAQAYVRLTERAASRIEIPGVSPSLTDNRTMGQNPVAADTRTFGTHVYFTPNQDNEFSLRADFNQQSYDNSTGQIGRIRRDAEGNFRDGYADELEFARTQLSLSHRALLDFGVWRTQLTHDVMETKGRTVPQGYFENMDGAARQLKLTTNIFNTSVAIPIGDHVVTLGGQYIDPTFDDSLIGSSISSSRYSLYAQNEWLATHNLTLTVGARYENDEDAGSDIAPRVYAVYHINENWMFKGGVSRGFSTPQLERKFDGVIGFGDGGSRPLFGNPELRNERSTSYEAGLLYNAGGALSGQVVYFYNDLENLIESGTGANAGTDLNIGEARIRGLESSVRYDFNPQWWLTANHTYVDSEVLFTQLDTGDRSRAIGSRIGDPLVSVPDHMANTRLNWQATETLKTFIEVEHRSDAYRPRNFHEPMTGGSSQGFVEPGVRDSNEVLGNFKGYSLLNIGASWQVNPNVEVYGSINNLLNHDFMDYQAYQICANAGCTESTTGFSNRYNSIREPARLFIGARLAF
ncbi:MAG: TonB-dependent receptor [Idiomarina sp.]|nr:TonB-dependent receptor [Idiomarina sp.]